MIPTLYIHYGFEHTKSWEFNLIVIISLPICCITEPKLNISPCPNIYGRHCLCFSSKWRDLCVSVKKKASGPEIFHLYSSGIVSCVDGVVFSAMLQTRCMACVSCGSILVYGQSHTEGSSGGVCRVDCEGWWQWLLWTTPLCPSPRPPRPTNPLILRQAHCEESPSQPSFPHGKYLTLTVAHVCHITCRF